MKKLVYILSSFLLALVINSNAKCQIITTAAGGATGHGGYWGDGGPATAAEMNFFAGLLTDLRGNIYISDGHRIRKVDVATGIINTIVGTGIGGYNGDGILATSAQIKNPICISFDTYENLYIYDYGNHRIRKVDAVTKTISTYAGNGTFGSLGDSGPATAATIDGGDMAWDVDGSLYITSSRKIRKISASGIISTYVGNGFPGITGEGVPATSTYISGPRGLAIDTYGNLFLVDSTHSVRKINALTGFINRVAGTGDNVGSPYTGDGIPASTCHINPFDISVDDTGNLYISDYGNSRIEKVDTFGIINTIAGTGISGFSGDGSLALAAQIDHPENVVLDKCNNVYIADFNNKRVRKVTFHPSCIPTLNAEIASNTPSVSIYPNPANDELHITSPGLSQGEVVLCNILGQVVLYEQLNSKHSTINIKHLPPGLYLLALTDEEGKRTVHKIIKE